MSSLDFLNTFDALKFHYDYMPTNKNIVLSMIRKYLISVLARHFLLTFWKVILKSVQMMSISNHTYTANR